METINSKMTLLPEEELKFKMVITGENIQEMKKFGEHL